MFAKSKYFKGKKFLSRSALMTTLALAAAAAVSLSVPATAWAETESEEEERRLAQEAEATEDCWDYQANKDKCTCENPQWGPEDGFYPLYVCDWNDEFTEVSAVYKLCRNCDGPIGDPVDCTIEVVKGNESYNCVSGTQYQWLATMTITDENGKSQTYTADTENGRIENGEGRIVWLGDDGGTHDLKREVKKPTCTSSGYTIYTCSKCDYGKEADWTDALGHSYGTPVFTWKGTSSCSAVLTCARCGEKQSGNCTISSAVTKAPTSTKKGVRTYTASITFTTGYTKYEDEWGEVAKKAVKTTFTDTKTEAIAAGTEMSNKITAKNVCANYSKKKQTVKLSAKATGGKLSYKSSSKKVKVSSSGKITITAKFSGTATITVTAKDTSGKYQTATKKIKVTVPKTTSVKSLKNTSGKKATVKWKKVSGVSGYQIQVAAKKNFSGKKTVNVSGAKKVTKKLTGLKKGKKAYVRIRTYKTVSGKKYYSAWSAVKSVKIKK